MRLLYIIFICLLAIPFIKPDHAGAREAGWVPLKNNNAASIQAPSRPGLNRASQRKLNEIPAGQKAPLPPRAKGATVYTNQPPVTEKEISSFIEVLPQFRVWARKNGEEAHPIVSSGGQPDFRYSDNVARWVSSHNFDPSRFFCIMGRLAAGLVIVEEGNDIKGTRPADMPSVDPAEISLIRKHLGELLTAGGPPGPLRSK